MSSTNVPNEIIFFHYPFSPYARRVTWYLALRGIPYAQCLQQPILPRPDLMALGVHYRRIPVLSHSNSIYCDSRLILSHLESAIPPSTSHPALNPTTATPASYDATLALLTTPTPTASTSPQTPLTHLLGRWTVESIFARCAALIPATSPVMQDPKFLADRSAFSGRKWSAEAQARNRPEALVVVRSAFETLETVFLADGREWIEGGDGRGGPGMADLEAVWPFHWVVTMPGALPAELISAKQYPLTFAWIMRFDVAVKEAKKRAPKPITLSGAESVAFVLSCVPAAEAEAVTAAVDAMDPLELRVGDRVEVYPTDSGFGHKDVGRLVVLNTEEIVIAVTTPGGEKEVLVHMPRWGFRVQKVSGDGGVARL